MSFWVCANWIITFAFCVPAYSTFYIVGLVLSMQVPFVGFQPIRTSEHMAAAGEQPYGCKAE